VLGFCRELPLPDGAPCSLGTQCESQFCSLDATRVCATPPLEIGRACGGSSSLCISHICFQGVCAIGLAEGQTCDDSITNPPCGPDLYCDREVTPPLCAKVHEAGEPCEIDDQCRGDCELRNGRYICDATPAFQAETCDGAQP